jgi:hypothetical protein
MTTPTTPPAGGLHAKLARIMAEIGSLPEPKKHKLGYSYTPDDDVYDAIRPLLVRENVMFWPAMTAVSQMPSPASDKMSRTLASFEYTFVDGDTGETFTVPWQGEADDANDKGTPKASTYAQKSFLLRMFMISSGADEPTSASASTGGRREEPPQPPTRTNGHSAPTDDYTPATDQRKLFPGEGWLNGLRPWLMQTRGIDDKAAGQLLLDAMVRAKKISDPDWAQLAAEPSLTVADGYKALMAHAEHPAQPAHAGR